MRAGERREREENKRRKRPHLTLGYFVRLVSWFLVLVTVFSVVMTFLSTFYIWVTEPFSSAKTLLWVLLITFSVWSLRNFLDARVYPIYKVHGILFLILALVAGFLLTTPVF